MNEANTHIKTTDKILKHKKECYTTLALLILIYSVGWLIFTIWTMVSILKGFNPSISTSIFFRLLFFLSYGVFFIIIYKHIREGISILYMRLLPVVISKQNFITATSLIIYGLFWFTYFLWVTLTGFMSWGLDELFFFSILSPFLIFFIILFIWGLNNIFKAGLLLLNNDFSGFVYASFGVFFVFFIGSWQVLGLLSQDYIMTHMQRIVYLCIYLIPNIFLFIQLYRTKKPYQAKLFPAPKNQTKKNLINFSLGFGIIFLLYLTSIFFHNNPWIEPFILFPIGLLGAFILYWRIQQGWLWLVMGILSGCGAYLLIELIQHGL